MVDADTPALTLATRGMVFAHLEVRTGTQPAHSGMYGGAALNAFHALHTALAAVLPGPDGRLPEPLRAGLIAPAQDELDELEDAARRRERAGAASARGRPIPTAAAEFYIRTTRRAVARRPQGRGRRRRARSSSRGRARRPVGAARRRPALARRSRANLETLLRDALPDGAELTFSADRAEPSRVRPRARPRCRPRGGRSRRPRREPALVRTGGTLPDPGGVRRARHPGDRLRLRAARRRAARARRVLPARRARAGRARPRARSTRSWPGCR